MKAILAGSLAVLVASIYAVSAQAPKSQWDGIYTAAQAKRGSGIYADKCSSCHGDNLTGGDNAPGLVGGEFSANWNDLRIGDLFERMRISMPQDAPGSLSRQDYADVLAFTLQKGNYPAGSTDLPTELDALNAIQFLSTKP